MSRSIRICSYLLLPLIYLLVNVKIAQLGESFPITIVTFLPVLLLLYVDKLNLKKADDFTGHRVWSDGV